MSRPASVHYVRSRLPSTRAIPVFYCGATPYLQPSLPESIALGTDFFRHNTGRPGGTLSGADHLRQHGVDNRPLWRLLLGLPLMVEMAKDELGEVVIARENPQLNSSSLRLRYDAGADRVEIGRYLREPEKEWLAEVIRAWLAEDDDAPARTTEPRRSPVR